MIGQRQPGLQDRPDGRRGRCRLAAFVHGEPPPAVTTEDDRAEVPRIGRRPASGGMIGRVKTVGGRGGQAACSSGVSERLASTDTDEPYEERIN